MSVSLRHWLIFLAAAVTSFALALNLPPREQPIAWMVAAAVLGALSGLVGRSWLGVLFLLVGWLIGLILELHLRLGAGPAALDELNFAANVHLAALGILLLTFAAGGLALVWMRRPPG